jgi:hypothetical protein
MRFKMNFFHKTALSAVLFCCFLAPISVEAGNEDSRRYGLKKMMVEYEITGAMMNGTETLYFDDWGYREAKHTVTEIKVGPISRTDDKIVYLEGAWTYTVDQNTKTGTKLENPYMKGLEGKNLCEVDGKMMIDMGGKKIGSETILGKKCDIGEVMGSKTWVWECIALKTVAGLAGMTMTYTATKISEDFDVKKLDRPDIDYKDMSAMLGKFKIGATGGQE